MKYENSRDFEKERERINNTLILLDMDKARKEVFNLWEKGSPGGILTGWSVFDKYFKFAPSGQLNIVTGTPGSGKSEWMDSLALNMAKNQGWKIFVYSPENYPASFHMQKLCEKYVGKPFFGEEIHEPSMTSEELNGAMDFIEEYFIFTDCHVNNASLDGVINTVFDECMEYNVQMAIIDPWNKLESNKPTAMSNTDHIGRSLTRLQMFARQKGISFWVVAHPAKPMKLKDGSMANLSLYDISDSAHWYNMADNGFILARDWDDKTGSNNKATMRIAKIKDRRYGRCGEIEFIFTPATGRYEAVALKDGGDTATTVRRWEGTYRPGTTGDEEVLPA